MVQKAEASRSNTGDNAKAKAKAKANSEKEKKDNGRAESPAQVMAEITKTLDPQKFLTMAQMEKSEIEELTTATIEAARSFEKMFEIWSAGFSARMEERVHTLEEMAKCDSQLDSLNLQTDCMQRLAEHWMADNQKLAGMYFDTMGKSFNNGNGWLTSCMKWQSEKNTGTESP